MGLEKHGIEKAAARPLHFFWILDCSGSMAGDKIAQLNFAIRETIPAMKGVAEQNINAEILVRALTFSDDARWHIAPPTRVEEFEWIDLEAGGLTGMGKAFKLLAGQLDSSAMPQRGLPPVLILVSDGEPTDEYRQSLSELLELTWVKKAVHIAIAVGDDANMDVLRQFIGSGGMKPMTAKNAHTLVNYIKFASTEAIKSSSAPQQRTANGKLNIPVPLPAALNDDHSVAGEVW